MHSTHYNPQALPRHDGKMILKKPLVFPIKKPDPILIKILQVIENMIDEKYENKLFEGDLKFIYKKDLLDALIDNDLIALKRKNEDYRKERSSYYAKLNQKFLNRMSMDQKYIEISSDKRNKKITLTSVGEEVLSIFEYLI